MMTIFRFSLMLFLSFFLSLYTGNLHAEEATEIKEIKIVGNNRIDSDVILSYMKFQSGDKIEKKLIDNSLKSLYASNLFSSIEINLNDNILSIKVVENPVIDQVVFKGNKKIDSDTIKNEISLTKRSVFNEKKLHDSIKRINDIYIKTGRYQSNIVVKTKKKGDDLIDVIFEIEEGSRATIEKILFMNNKAFSSNDLLDVISSKTEEWYRFSGSYVFDNDRILFDKEKLRRFYHSKGYADFEITSSNSQINKNKSKFIVTMALNEGPKYNFGKISVKNNIKKFTKDKLLQNALKMKEGKVYNADLVESTIDEMSEILGKNGYPFVDIVPNLNKNREDLTIGIEFVVNEISKFYINKITISGNENTKDEVIRRELRILEGDPYNLSKIRRSMQRLRNLGFFNNVDIKTRKTDIPDKVDLEVIIEEKKTGELNLGVGYSNVNRVTGTVGVKERNLAGTGRELSLQVEKSQYRFGTDLTYLEPYVGNKNLNVGFSVFNAQNKAIFLPYQEDTNGASISGIYSITEHISHNLSYSYKRSKISNIMDSANFIIRQLKGVNIVSEVSNSLSYNNVDNVYNPTKGIYASISHAISGLVNGQKYNSFTTDFSIYRYIINPKFVYKFSESTGIINGYGGDKVLLNNGYTLGGYRFRGFQFAGVGPKVARRDSSGNLVLSNGQKLYDPIPGKEFYLITNELKFPLGLPEELGIYGSVFTDIGSVTGVDFSNQDDVIDSGNVRISTGFSLGWTSPIGLINLDFSKIIRKDPLDTTQTFRFNFGRRF